MDQENSSVVIDNNHVVKFNPAFEYSMFKSSIKV